MAINCDVFKQNIDAYVDGELASRQREEMDAHADECADCREALDQAISLSTLCAELNGELTVPLEAQLAWRKAVRAEAYRKRAYARRWIRGVGSVAAALVVLITGTFGARVQESAAPVSGTAESALVENVSYGSTVARNMDAQNGRGGVSARSPMTLGVLQSDGSIGGQKSVATADEDSVVETVVLRSAERSIRSVSYEADCLWLQNLVEEYDAWFEERTMTAPTEDDQLIGRVSSAVVRVPSERLDDFLTELDQLGQTVVRSESAEDVTGKYVDTQSRMDTLKAQKEKLDEMLNGCEDVNELIAIDDKLTDVIASIESLEGDLRRQKSQINYSRVTLTLTELVQTTSETSDSLSERMQTGFNESVQWLGEFGQDALVVLASAMPKLVVWIPAVILVGILLRTIFKRRR